MLAEEISGDAEAVRDLVRFEEPDVAVSLFTRWRQRHDEVLVVVDQFEELFTQNPPEVQERFADLLARLALEADVHVLLSMRDDFLFHCSTHDSAGADLQRDDAVEAPLRIGSPPRPGSSRPSSAATASRTKRWSTRWWLRWRVSGARCRLLAFAASRLWDHRDREQGVLTREA